jgi:hypothetical protein
MTAIPIDQQRDERWVWRFLRHYFGLYVLTMAVLLVGVLIPGDLLGGGPRQLTMGLFQLGLVLGAVVVAIGARDSALTITASPQLNPSPDHLREPDDAIHSSAA